MLQGLFGGGNLQSFMYELLLRLPAILVSLAFHEWGHAYAAYRNGDPTARNLGRMTLNPLAHVDPVGFICLLLFRFGWAKPVPVTPRNYTNQRKGTVLVSLAGVTMNFLLAVISTFIIFVFIVLGIENEILWGIMENFLFINLSLMIFNLIPVPPLDGSHLLEVALIRKIGPKPFYFLSQYGHFILIILMVTDITDVIIGSLSNVILSGLIFVFGHLFGALL